MTTSESDRRKL